MGENTAIELVESKAHNLWILLFSLGMIGATAWILLVSSFNPFHSAAFGWREFVLLLWCVAWPYAAYSSIISLLFPARLKIDEQGFALHTRNKATSWLWRDVGGFQYQHGQRGIVTGIRFEIAPGPGAGGPACGYLPLGWKTPDDKVLELLKARKAASVAQSRQ